MTLIRFCAASPWRRMGCVQDQTVPPLQQAVFPRLIWINGLGADLFTPINASWIVYESGFVKQTVSIV